MTSAPIRLEPYSASGHHTVMAVRPRGYSMSKPSSSVSHKKLQDVIAAADAMKRQMSELQALREEVDRAEALHISERQQRQPEQTNRVS